MLTKEEYIDIIENLDFFYGDNLITTAELRKKKHRETQEKDLENFKKKINCLKQLINEHFDNPPLKFEELKPNMWVFDNKYGIYIKIRSVKKKNSFIGYYQNFECNPETDESYENLQGIFFFEENRFYRREVE